MSRHYEMHILVKGFKDETEITMAIEDEWSVMDSWQDNEESSGVLFMGNGSLVGGEGEDAFARRVRNAIWKANGEYCEVEVKCIYLDDPPTSYHTFNEEDYKKWKELQ